jgi:hypothetical protein
MELETYTIQHLISENWFLIISNCISFAFGVVMAILFVSVKEVDIAVDFDEPKED